MVIESDITGLKIIQISIQIKSQIWRLTITARFLEASRAGNNEILKTRGSKSSNKLKNPQRYAFRCLVNKDSIVIKVADKGDASVIMDGSEFISACKGVLNDKTSYEELLVDPKANYTV